jgi:hypothetical protein
MENQGFIKVYRKILEWEWFTDPNTSHLFMYLLLSANYTPQKWHGNVIQRGQLLTNLKEIQKDTGISLQSVRTCLKRLVKTKEITVEPTNKYSIITVCKYDNYQCLPDVDDNQSTSNEQTNIIQQTSNDQSTNIQPTLYKEYNKNIKKEKKEKKEKNTDKANALYAISGLSDSQILDTTMEYFNSSIDKNKSGMRKIRSISNDRRRLTLARYKEYGLDGIKQMIDNATTSEFLGNPSDKWHGADFNWLMKPNNFPKVLEGKYNNADTSAGNGKQGSADDDGYADFLKFCKSNTPNLYEKIKSIGNHALYEFKRLSGGDGRKTSDVLEAMDRDNFQGDLFEEFGKRIRRYG